MFYRATVENNNDPQQYGRVQVRIHGIHDSGSSVSISALPWAEVAGGTDFGLVDGVGITSVLRIGTLVWCFLNYDDPNYPVIFAVIKGSSDINSTAKGSYTNIATLKTASGHLIQLGDAGGAENIKITHKSGTYIEFLPDGSITMEVKTNLNINTTGNTEIKTTGEVKQITTGSHKLQSGPNLDIDAGTIYLN